MEFMRLPTNGLSHIRKTRSLSKKCSLKYGIHQGTILGPLLFLVFINYLPNCLSNSHPRMYADDTNLTYSGSDINTIQFHLNEDLANINEWLISNKLTLNMTKTEYMLIGSIQRLSTLSGNPSFEINGIPLDRVSTTKSLGVLSDENLTCSSHINKMTKRIASAWYRCY